ncbi:MAG: alpha/beta hydrolase [Burkholderiales bacterium]
MALVLLLAMSPVIAEDKVIDIPTRSGVTQRFLLIPAPDAKAAVVLFAGGHGGLQLDQAGNARWGNNNFLVRSARLFASHDLTVAVIDAPSDKLSPPYLSGFRHSSEHAADVKAVIAWLKDQTKVPVWLIGTSRGTQSVGAVSTMMGSNGGPDGIVLTSTILSDARSRPVPDMALEKLTIPVLVVHHEQDACRACPFREIPRLMNKLSATPRKQLITFRGGENQGDPCEALAYHGFNGLEAEVVGRIAAWITS